MLSGHANLFCPLVLPSLNLFSLYLFEFPLLTLHFLLRGENPSAACPKACYSLPRPPLFSLMKSLFYLSLFVFEPQFPLYHEMMANSTLSCRVILYLATKRWTAGIRYSRLLPLIFYLINMRREHSSDSFSTFLLLFLD